ncbi:MAG: protein-L-isoaspartate(D-aspartate) O-methyltransferase [bacterium]
MKLIMLVICLMLVFFGCSWAEEMKSGYLEARMQMVKTQLIDRGIKDERVLSAMRRVERHLFVPEKYRNQAYADMPLPIGEGQTISQPYIVAFMTEILKLQENDKILEIGTGSGYQAAVLAEICKTVFTIEINEKLAEFAKENLKHAGYENVKTLCGDGYLGWPSEAPFDVIIVTCAPSDIPAPLKEQLADGGRMIIPVDSIWGQELVLLTKTGQKIERKDVLPVRFVPMVRDDGTKY